VPASRSGRLLAAAASQLGGWQAAYWPEAVLAAVLAVALPVLLTESRAEHTRPLDVPGVVLLAAGIGALLAGLVEARNGPTRPIVLVSVIAGLILLGTWFTVEHRRRDPMIDPALFRSPQFLAATLGALATGAGTTSTISFLFTVISKGLGRTSVAAALFVLVCSATSVAASLLSRRLPASWNGRIQLGIGLLIVAVGQVLLLGATPDSSLEHYVPGLLIAGVASGVVNAALGREAVA
jgi:Na+/melibiose symporter-like transporter